MEARNEQSLDPANPFAEVIKLDADTKRFEAAGRIFFVNNASIEDWPIERYERWERLNIELTFVLSIPSIYSLLERVEDLIMNDKRKEAFTEVSNLRRGIARLTDDRATIAFYMCTLFIVEEGEDPFTWDIETANSKIECWKQHYDTGFFLGQAIGLLNGYKAAFLSITQEFSELTKLAQQMESETIENSLNT